MINMDAFVRPIFMRPRTETEPKIYTYDTGAIGVGAVTYNIIPPTGETWAVDYVSIIAITTSTNNQEAYIQIVDTVAGTTTTIEVDKTMSVIGDRISFGSFGNGPLYIKNKFYLRIYVVCTANTAEFEAVVSITKV